MNSIKDAHGTCDGLTHPVCWFPSLVVPHSMYSLPLCLTCGWVCSIPQLRLAQTKSVSCLCSCASILLA